MIGQKKTSFNLKLQKFPNVIYKIGPETGPIENLAEISEVSRENSGWLAIHLSPKVWACMIGREYCMLQSSLMDKLRGLVGRVLSVDKWRDWFIHIDLIVIHPNYYHYGKFTV